LQLALVPNFNFCKQISENYSVGRYAEGRTRQGMDHYASKAKNAPVSSSLPTQVTNFHES
jgi:hypothetical protein